MNERWHTKVRPLNWYGGKARNADWIANLLPWHKSSLYVETHGGMASIMAIRAPVKCEIFNDLDSRVVNWWSMLREKTEELDKLVTLTPHSKEEYWNALDKIEDE